MEGRLANPQNAPSQGDKNKSNGTSGNRQSLAAELEALANQPAPEKRDSLGKAIAQLLVFVVILGGIGYGYYTYAKNAGKVFDVLRETRDLQRQDSYEKLKETHTKLADALAIKSEGRLVALLAETDVLLACEHKDDAFKADAEKYTAQAANDDVQRAERYSAEGYLKICQGDAIGAEQYLARIMQKGAMDPRIMHAYGVALLAQGRTVEARDILKKAADAGPGNPRFPTSLGDAEVLAGNYFEAQQQFGRAVNINGGHVRARLGKLLAEGLGGVSAEKVMGDLDKVLKGNPAPSRGELEYAQYVRAEVLARAGALTNAEKVLAGVKEQSGRVSLLKGRVALLKGDEKAAMKAFDEAAAKEPLNPQVYLVPATLLVDMDKGAEALARLQGYQKAKIPETHEFFSLQGDALALTGKPEDAAKAYQQALEKQENNIRSMIGTGKLLIDKKKWEEAGALLEKVTTMQPDNGEPWYVMCGAYMEQKDFGYASQMCDKSVELYKKKNAEPRFVVKALKRAAKAHEMNKNKKEADARAKEASDLEKLR